MWFLGVQITKVKHGELGRAHPKETEVKREGRTDQKQAEKGRPTYTLQFTHNNSLKAATLIIVTITGCSRLHNHNQHLTSPSIVYRREKNTRHNTYCTTTINSVVDTCNYTHNAAGNYNYTSW